MKKPALLLWILAAAIGLFFWVYLPSLSKYHDLKMQQEDLDKQIEKYTREVELIREERDLLKNDPEYLQKVIRDEMGLVKPGEIVYKFVQESPEQAQDLVEELPIELRTTPVAAPSPKPSGLTVEARPVPTSAPKTVAAITPKKPLTPAATEPVYPRRETR